MKRRITEKGAPRTRKEAEKAWTKCWKDLSQARIQRWIERISRHITEVIRLRGGNVYRETRVGGEVRSYDLNERVNEYIRSYTKHDKVVEIMRAFPEMPRMPRSAWGFEQNLKTMIRP